MNNIRIIKTASEAEEALVDLTSRKYATELSAIRKAAQTMSCSRAGMPGRQQAIRAVLTGFAGNVAEMSS